MTITFKSKLGNKDIHIIENVKAVIPGRWFFGEDAYGVDYTDGTFSQFNYSSWELIKVEQ